MLHWFDLCCSWYFHQYLQQHQRGGTKKGKMFSQLHYIISLLLVWRNKSIWDSRSWEVFFRVSAFYLFIFISFHRLRANTRVKTWKKEKNLQVVPLNEFCCVWNLHKLFHLHKPVKAALISALWIIRGHNSLNGMKKLKAQVFSSFCPMSQWPIIFLFLLTTNNDKFSFQFFCVDFLLLIFLCLASCSYIFIYTCMCLILNNLLGLEYLWTIQKRRKEDLRQQKKKKRRWRRTEKENVF